MVSASFEAVYQKQKAGFARESYCDKMSGEQSHSVIAILCAAHCDGGRVGRFIRNLVHTVVAMC